MSGAILDYAGKACQRVKRSSLLGTFINYSGATTLMIMTISTMTLSISTLSITTLRIITFSITIKNMTLSTMRFSIMAEC